MESMGTEQNRKVYKRHGAGDKLYGVSCANLKLLKKKIKTDHNLAVDLWATDNTDAQTLALMIADPQQFTENDLNNWLKDMSYYVLVDTFVRNIVISTPYSQQKLEEWTALDDEWEERAGWRIVAHIAMGNNDLDDSYFSGLLANIEKNIHTSKNRVKDAMNGALIAIGLRSEVLEKAAIAAAQIIGKVNVDHGDTSCKTPNAIAYIEKTKKHRKR